MNYVLLAILPIVAVLSSTVIIARKHKKGLSSKRAMRLNLATFFVLAAMIGLFTFFVSAETSTAATTNGTSTSAATTESSSTGLGFIAAGLSTGLAGIGGGIAVASGSSAAIGATSEDPKIFGKALIFVALGESIALYGVVVSILILNKIYGD